jgi:hypothetical protein
MTASASDKASALPWTWDKLTQVKESEFPVTECLLDFIDKGKVQFARKGYVWDREVIGLRYDVWRQLIAELFIQEPETVLHMKMVLVWQDARIVPFIMTEQIFALRPEISVCYLSFPNGELYAL